MWNSQWFFLITELPVTLSMVFSMSVLHILLALPEKMLWSLFFAGYDKLPVARDLLLMGGDFSSALYALYLWKAGPVDDNDGSPGRRRTRSNDPNVIGGADIDEKLGIHVLLTRSAFLVGPLYLFYQTFCAFE
ncbi:MAG: hypothetical protein SGCHY_004933 [Lobulomycetales sp.]